MSFDPTLEDQQLLEDTLRRPGSGMTRREILAGVLSAAGFIAAVVAVWLIQDPGSFPILPPVVCLLVLALSMRVHFDTPLGFTVPTQLAFVPLVFAAPLAIVPIAVVAAFIVAMVPDIRTGRVRPSRLLNAVSNSWFALGPVAVLAITNTRPQDAGALLLIAALLAQFLLDWVASAVRFAITREAGLSSLRDSTWVYGIDAGLTAPGLLAAHGIHQTPLAALAMVPLLGLMSLFATERNRRLEGMLELSSAYRGTALVLGDVIEADDGYTGAHCKSVVALTLELAEHLNLSAECRRNLEFGALLHDVGKIAIPKEIINKPGKLDPHEWTIVKAHTVEGQKMLDRVGGFMREVGAIVRSHHERWDGGGYPDGLAGEQIPLEARIISCCDTWNAMRTDRPYRMALDYEVAGAELIAASGSQLDPILVDALLELVASEAPEARPFSPDAAGAPQRRLEYGYARPAC